MNTELVSIAAAASYLSLSPQSVRRRVALGELPCVKLSKRNYKIPASALDAYLAERTYEASA